MTLRKIDENMIDPNFVGKVNNHTEQLAETEKKTRNIVSVLQYENLKTVIASGYDWTPSIQQAIADATEGTKIIFPPSTEIYYFGNIDVNKSLIFSGYGATLQPISGISGFKLAQAIVLKDLIFEGFSFIGDGTVNLATNGVITNVSGSNVVSPIYRDMKFENLPFGIYLNSESSGYYKNPLISNCKFKNIVGGSSGSGLGIAISGGDINTVNAEIIGCEFDTCYRHSLYISSGSGISVFGNTFLNHRKNNHDELYISLAALQISRCSDVTVLKNKFKNCFESAVHVHTDSLSREVDNIFVFGNEFIDSDRFDISIGNDNPDIIGQTKNVKFSNNKIKRKNNANPSIYIQSAIGLSITDNEFDAVAVTVEHIGGLIVPYTFGSTNPSTDYIIKRNKIKMLLTGTKRAFNIQNVVSGTSKIEISQNDVEAAQPIFYTSAITNPNLIIDARKISTNANTPTGGLRARGDIAYNTNVTTGSPLGWVYISGSLGWVSIGQVGYRSNAGNPNGIVTPLQIGEELLDSTNRHWYKAVGMAITDWKQTTI